MLALYARQSVEKSDSVSIDTQLDFCKFEAHSEEVKIYVDRGFSGKNTQRPEFQQMMEDIKTGKISKVICYKLDRVSRSILDFFKMMELLQLYNVEFVSSTERFDTSTPMGRAMLNICIVFAQLERETIQKRVTDAYYSMAQKGFYLGGKVPYGFDLESTTLNGKKTSKYVPHPIEQDHIRKMFEIYAEPQATYTTVLKFFIKNNTIHNRGKIWSLARISELLRNPIYVKANLDVYNFFKSQGAQIANEPEDFVGANGCFLYKGRDDKKKYSLIEGQNLVIAMNDGLIEADIWLKCRRKALGHQQIERGSKPKNSWLAGKVKCGKCGYALTIRKSKTKIGRYFICSGKSNNRTCEGAGTIYAPAFENIILEKIKEKLQDFAKIIHTDESSPAPIANDVKLSITKIDNEISQLMDKVATANDTLVRYINERIEKLDTQKAELQQKLDSQTQTKSSGKIVILENYIDRWEEISFDDKRFVVSTLIKVITVADGQIQIHWNI